MKFINLLLLALLLLSVACSGGKSKNAEEGDVEEVASSDDDYVEYILDEDEEGKDEDFADSGDKEDEEEYIMDDEKGDEEYADADEEEEEAPAVAMSGDQGSYKVKGGETLMMIAFNLYGDYRMWRKIKNSNGLQSSRISKGQSLRYDRPERPFKWDPEGLPYLIQGGDTLGTISNDKYGTPSKWKSIYSNNRPLIKDPNLIFAGFTLYYLQDARDIASE